jgi:hypothetical protein
MNQMNKLLILCLCIVLANCESNIINKPPKNGVTEKLKEEDDTLTIKKSPKDSVTGEPAKALKKRQLPDYYNLFLDYAAYDYYDWVCTGRQCQLCDVLTGDCCDPRQPNCFLPDSCSNNPCLSGGTCITTRTIDNQPDFSCVCKAGLTGKYCQLVDEFAIPGPIPPILPPPVIPAPARPLPPAPAPVAPTYHVNTPQRGIPTYRASPPPAAAGGYSNYGASGFGSRNFGGKRKKRSFVVVNKMNKSTQEWENENKAYNWKNFFFFF